MEGREGKTRLGREGMERRSAITYVRFEEVCWFCPVNADDARRVLEATEGRARQECFLFDEGSVSVYVREEPWQQSDYIYIYSTITAHKHKGKERI